MKVSDEQIDHFHTHGFVIVPGFVGGQVLKAAQDALRLHFPTPAQYFADPAAYPRFAESQFAGIDVFPWKHLALNHLAVQPDLIDAVRRILKTADVRLYKGELWAKFAGAVDYGQLLHRDFGNHTLVVPDALGRWRQITTFLLLTDTDESSGATAIVSRRDSEHVPLSARTAGESLRAKEVRVTGAAGTLLIYTTDIFHRGTRLRGEKTHRFALLADFKPADMTWGARHAWPAHGNMPEMSELLSAIGSDQRSLFDFPAPGHPYWNEQTITDTQARYPDMDMADYWQAFRGGA